MGMHLTYPTRIIIALFFIIRTLTGDGLILEFQVCRKIYGDGYLLNKDKKILLETKSIMDPPQLS